MSWRSPKRGCTPRPGPAGSSPPRSLSSGQRPWLDAGPGSPATTASWRRSTMHDAWYEVVGADARLTQGDFIFDCPLSIWVETAVDEPPVGGLGTLPEALPELEVLLKR